MDRPIKYHIVVNESSITVCGRKVNKEDQNWEAYRGSIEEEEKCKICFRKKIKEMDCPICGEELDAIEVDVGVGTIYGSGYCNYCSFSEEEHSEEVIKNKRRGV